MINFCIAYFFLFIPQIYQKKPNYPYQAYQSYSHRTLLLCLVSGFPNILCTFRKLLNLIINFTFYLFCCNTPKYIGHSSLL